MKQLLHDLVIPAVMLLILIVLILFVPGVTDLTWRLYDLSLGLKPDIPQHPSLVIANIDDPTIEQLNMYPLSRDIIGWGMISMAEFGAEILAIDSEYLDTSPRVVREDFLAQELPVDFENTFGTLADTTLQILQIILSDPTYTQEEIDDLVFQLLDYNEFLRDSLFSRVQETVRDNDVFLGQAGRFFGRAHGTVTPAQDPSYVISDQLQALLESLVALPNVEVIRDSRKQNPKGILQTSYLSPTIYPVLSGLAGGGSVAIVVDSDGVRRRVDLLFEYKGKVYPHLSLAGVLDLYGNPPVRVDNQGVTLVGARLPQGGTRDILLPLDQNGHMLIHWPRTSFIESFRQVPYRLLWDNQEQFRFLENNLRLIDSLGLLVFFDGPYLLDYPPAIQEVLEWGMETGDREAVQEYRELRQAFLNDVAAFIHGPYEEIGIEEYEYLLSLPDYGPEDRAFLQSNLELLKAAFAESRVILERLTTIRDFLRRELEGSIVVLGYSGKSTTDIGVNPFEKEYMNVGTYPAIINSMLQQQFLRDAPWWVSLLILLPLGVFIPFLFHWAGPLRGMVLSVIVLLLAIGGFFAVFVFAGIYLDQFLVLSYLSPTILGVLVLNFRRTNSQKAFITDAFGQYLSEEVIQELIADPEKLQLGGEKREMTAIFTDVKGFSTISEALDPTDLVTLLNEYLSAMSDQVLDQRGTIDKYEGDAIIAFFGAPVPLPDHAARACEAAIRMRSIETELNQRFMSNSMTPNPLLTRIGINTGEMVVGNMGTQRKKNYTIMGNAVNLAARLEGVNKQYNTWILLSDATYQQLGGQFLCRRLDRVRVVGINEPIQLWELMARLDQAPAELKAEMDQFEEALLLFEQREYPKSQKAFEQIIREKGKGGPADIYYLRSKEFIQNPRPDSWDGVFNLTSK